MNFLSEWRYLSKKSKLCFDASQASDIVFNQISKCWFCFSRKWLKTCSIWIAWPPPKIDSRRPDWPPLSSVHLLLNCTREQFYRVGWEPCSSHRCVYIGSIFLQNEITLLSFARRCVWQSWVCAKTRDSPTLTCIRAFCYQNSVTLPAALN